MAQATHGRRKLGTRRDAVRNHERLVAAAHEVFAERGVDGSLEEIARRAGVGTGTLYRHFATREALVEAVFERAVAEFVPLAERAAARDDAWEGLCEFLELSLERQAANRGLNDVITRWSPTAGRLEARRTIVALLERLIERAHEQGALRRDFEAADVYTLFWAHSRVIETTAGVAPEHWRRYYRIVLDGLRADSATPLPEPPLTPRQLDAVRATLRNAHAR